MAKRAQPIQAHHVNNIVRTVLAATPAERTAGLLWYPTFSVQAIEYGAAHGLNAAQSLALFAVLSQRARIHRNVANFQTIAATKSTNGTVCVFGAMRKKCMAILSDPVDPGQHARGEKISAFLANLAGDAQAVTVDRHAISCAFDRMTNQVGSHYDYVARCYRAAAAILEITPRECQAIAWVVWRRLKGIVDEDEDLIA